MNIAVVDEGGNLLAFARMDGAWLGSIDIAINKAFTSRAFDIATKDLSKLSQPGEDFFGIHVSNHGRIMIFAGGVPLKQGGKVIGAIGVSGGSGKQDQTVAEAGAAAINPSPSIIRTDPHSPRRSGSAKIEEMTKQRVKVRVPDLLKMKRSGQKITMLTAYDATMALLLDRAGIDVILVGDSLGMVVLGEETTVGVTLDMMTHHCRAVANGASTALVVADLPFLTYQTSIPDAVRNAGRLMQQGRAAAVKLEGGVAVAETVRALVSAGIPVMGHVGLLPQSVHLLGGFHAVGKNNREAEQVAAWMPMLLKRQAHSRWCSSAFPTACQTCHGRAFDPYHRNRSGPHCDGTGSGQLRCLRPLSRFCAAFCQTIRRSRRD